MVSPVDDSRTVIARLSVPEKVSPFQVTATAALLAAAPDWKVPWEAAIESTTVWLKRSHVGVKEACPSAVPCDTVTEDGAPVAPIGQATAMAMLTPPPDAPVSWPWSASRAVTPGSSRIALELEVWNSCPLRWMVR